MALMLQADNFTRLRPPACIAQNQIRNCSRRAAHAPLCSISLALVNSALQDLMQLCSLERLSPTHGLGADLMKLRSLTLEGNPIVGAPFARLRALACLPQRSQGLCLDGSTATPGEMSVLAACGGERLPAEFAVISR